MKLDPAIQLSNELRFETTESLLSFLEAEIDFWSEINDTTDIRDTPYYCFYICNTLHTKITTALSSKVSDTDKLTAITQALNDRNIQPTNFFNNYYLSHKDPIGIKFKDITKSYSANDAIWFWKSLKSKKLNVNHTINNESFIGTMLAYEFSFNDSELPKRRNTNLKSISEYQNQLSNAVIESRDATTKLLDTTNEACEALITQLSDFNEQSSIDFNDKIESHDTVFNEELKRWTTEKNRLENLYTEKLKLAKPADYWKKAAAKHERLAVFSSALLAVVAIISTTFIGSFFFRWLENFGEIAFKPASLQGVLLFGVLIAIIGFILKVLSRIIFSSLHLARDAEEREQLTYFYLALKNESEMSSDDRNLILTALFSRSETGLLTNEHGPTLPIADVIKSVPK